MVCANAKTKGIAVLRKDDTSMNLMQEENLLEMLQINERAMRELSQN